MRMRHQDKIDRRQMVNFEPRLFQALNYLEPFRPNRVDQNIDRMRLNQKRRMADPCDADLAFADLGKFRGRLSPRPLHKKRWNQHAGEKIALVPIGSWTQTDTRGMLNPWNRTLFAR